MRRLLLLVVMLIVNIGCDQVTKQIAITHLRAAPTLSLVGDILRLQYAENPGAFLGLGHHLSPTLRFWLFTVFNVALLAVFLGMMMRYWDMGATKFVAGAFFLGGGVGNTIDRIVHKGIVIDFLNLGIGPVRTGIFNLADMAMTLSVMMLLVVYVREARHKSAPLT